MLRWSAIAEAAPAVVDWTERCFAARRMKCLATLRRDGTPRLSETSGVVVADGDLWLAMIPSAKARDLIHDQRVSIHCGSPSDDWGASARVSGAAVAASNEEVARFSDATGRAAISFGLHPVTVWEIVVTRPHPETGDILIEWWNSRSGLGQASRAPGR